MVFPPLIGDARGRYRIRIIGNSGSGKSTLGAELANILNIPHISLDTLYFEPGWKEIPHEKLQEKIRCAMRENDETGWIIDGNYERGGGWIVNEHATDIIWLDPPLALYFPRLFLRTILRLLRLRPPCSPECQETVREAFFSKDSIILFCLNQHKVVIRRGEALMKVLGLGVGSVPPSEQKMRRIGGWGKELKNWLAEVKRMHGSQ